MEKASQYKKDDVTVDMTCRSDMEDQSFTMRHHDEEEAEPFFAYRIQNCFEDD